MSLLTKMMKTNTLIPTPPEQTNQAQLIKWLLQGDPAIQYQTTRDLLGEDNKSLQQQITKKGWGKLFLAQRKPNGHWGEQFYQPKWISTHYTLLDLRYLCMDPNNPLVKSSIEMVLHDGKSEDGGIPLGPSTQKYSDVCVNAMFLNYAAYFGTEEKQLQSIIDCLLNEIMPDGGFNCQVVRSGAHHSSLHSTISVLEGLYEFLKNGYTYRKADINKAISSAEEFILIHQFFLSDRTGKIIKKDFLKLTYPGRWKYNILRALDYFQYAGRKWDDRMTAAIEVLLKKRNKDGTLNNQAAHAGQVHFVMEKAGEPSRWNTLRALRVLKHFEKEIGD